MNAWGEGSGLAPAPLGGWKSGTFAGAPHVVGLIATAGR
jgi:hypothetical protein